MPMRLDAFERDLTLAAAGLSPEEIARRLAELAQRGLAEAQASGAASSSYVLTVNGRAGVAEAAVVPPGPILYTFSWLTEVKDYGLAFLRTRSPKASGRYADSHFAMVNGSPIGPDEPVPFGAELVLSNPVPYARKIEVGHMKMSVPAHVYEDAQQAIRRKFGELVAVALSFVLLEGGYVLKGRFRRGSGRAARKSPRKDTGRGQPLRYPALVITMKDF